MIFDVFILRIRYLLQTRKNRNIMIYIVLVKFIYDFRKLAL